jgi:hypothetical protein
MELFQAAQWMWGHVGHCDNINEQFTLFAGALIWTQPLIFSEILKSAVSRVREYTQLVRFLFIASIIVFISGTKSIISSCTIIGPHHHLAWQFEYRENQLVPNHFTYMVLIGTTLFLSPPRIKYTIGIGWAMSCLYSLWRIGYGIEFASYWCWMSVLSCIPMLLSCYLF